MIGVKSPLKGDLRKGQSCWMGCGSISRRSQRICGAECRVGAGKGFQAGLCSFMLLGAEFLLKKITGFLFHLTHLALEEEPHIKFGVIFLVSHVPVSRVVRL